MRKKEDPKVTRRKLLGGAGALGFLTVTTGIGRAVLHEPVEFNQSTTLQVNGELNLRLDWRETYNGEVVEGDGTFGDRGDYRDGVSGALIDLGNVMPGDRGTVTVSPRPMLDGEPAPGRVYMWFEVGSNPYRENGVVEPEVRAGDTTPGEGELQDHVDASVWYDNGFMEAGGCDGTFSVGESELASGSFAEVISELSGPEEATVVRDCLGADESVCIGLEWSLPEGVGNVVQSDSVEFGLGFAVESCMEGDSE